METVFAQVAATRVSGLSIISRANEIASLSARGENLIAACAILSTEETHSLKEADLLARRFLQIDLGKNGNARTALEGMFEPLE
ncbi:MutS protein msh5 [Penicillium alfredii]|uniref:MutS protein msh5 n=1 Tax=Penicillium alfredii TaxID=1506179 RepID=A0A9W9F1G8_9EURO|nr:MutS protein msh5 [Penicillium alfredii]KAJ5091751.1 MutS protein msh5 [Penicillium alfredii]